VEGLLVEVRGSAERTILEMQDGRRSFVARLNAVDNALRSLPAGCRLKLTGVYAAQGGSSVLGSRTTSFELLLDSPAEVKVLARPPWWTLKHVLVVMEALTTALMAAVGWVYLLRRRVRLATAQLQEETQVSATLAERNRLASEIHDSLQQSITGIMMQLDAATATLDENENPETVRGYLDSAQSMAQFSLTEIEHALWNWQSPALENADLGMALQHIAQQVSSASRTQVTVERDGPLRRLGPTVEHHLLRIGQESITNALKHAQAQNIFVVLSYSESSVRISIRDDGCGFVPGKALSAHQGHFGLESLRGRARKMGAQFNVLSAPGKGATIEVVVPLRTDGSCLISTA
jgi:signal transduction histidine kinase